MRNTVEITDANFEEIMGTDKVVLVDFWATWCGPCKVVAPSVEELADEYEGRAVVGKVDVDNNPQVANQFGIRSIPTLLFFKNGQVVDKLVGALPKSKIERTLENWV
ncbi:MAG: thioredoxin [Bacteroidetes bacterium]|nr:MAG: thioredoxin [Bacteroidota bacterium]